VYKIFLKTTKREVLLKKAKEVFKNFEYLELKK